MQQAGPTKLDYKRRHDKVAGAVYWSHCSKHSAQCSQQHTAECTQRISGFVFMRYINLLLTLTLSW